MALTKAEINKRYRLKDPERFREQNRKYYLRRKAQIEKQKEIEALNEALENEDVSIGS